MQVFYKFTIKLHLLFKLLGDCQAIVSNPRNMVMGVMVLGLNGCRQGNGGMDKKAAAFL